MSEESASRNSLRITGWIAVSIFAVVFLPLGLAVAEHFILGSDHVEEFCKRIGVHDTLDQVYRPLLDLFR